MARLSYQIDDRRWDTADAAHRQRSIDLIARNYSKATPKQQAEMQAVLERWRATLVRETEGTLYQNVCRLLEEISTLPPPGKRVKESQRLTKSEKPETRETIVDVQRKPSFTPKEPERGSVTPRKEDQDETEQARLADRLEEIARAYDEAVTEMENASREKRDDLSRRMQPQLDAYARHLNAYVKIQPQSTIDDKRKLQQSVNGDIRSSRGIALKCPTTGDPSLLQIATGDYPESGYFQFYHYEYGKRIVTATRSTLSDLEVVIANLSTSPRGGHKGLTHAEVEDHRRAAKRTRQKS